MTDSLRPQPHVRLPGIEPDLELLDLASINLGKSGFECSRLEIDGVPALTALSQFGFLFVASFLTVDAMLTAEPRFSGELARLLTTNDELARTRWDGYLVLLTSQNAEAHHSQSLFAVAYNLRQVRRLLKVGVEPTITGVGRALRPVLPLVVPQYLKASLNPLTALEERLLRDGFDAEQLTVALRRFDQLRVAGMTSSADESAIDENSADEER